MQTQTQMQSFTDPSIMYSIEDDGHGHITCSCPDYEKRRAALGTTCKHMRAYLEDHYDVPDLVMRDGKPFVLNKKGKWVSWAQFMHLAHARASKAGEASVVPVPAPAPVAKPVRAVSGVNTDAIALLDSIENISKLESQIEQLKRDLTRGKTASFVVPVGILDTTLIFEKIGRGWRVKTIKNQ